MEPQTIFANTLDSITLQHPEVVSACEQSVTNTQCFIAQLMSTDAKDWTVMPMSMCVVQCHNFGLFVTFRSWPRKSDKQMPAARERSVTSVLMTSATAAALTLPALPQKHAAPKEPEKFLHGDLRLENDIVDLLQSKRVGFRNGAESTAGKTLVRNLWSFLFEVLAPSRLQTLKNRNLVLPQLFQPLLANEVYNNPTKQGHCRLPQLSCVQVLDMVKIFVGETVTTPSSTAQLRGCTHQYKFVGQRA